MKKEEAKQLADKYKYAKEIKGEYKDYKVDVQTRKGGEQFEQVSLQ